ncbi:MAG TPA: GGDEF domain-containing protein [Acidobacteriota bacterium]|nr:GGDEF domain-containing protein [Acidobacteriota bacterium]HNB71937.1 GGDEF domain-containing protein [Acidobacteriota bacterium]HNG94104.1 GGDEF domain-containing protein [Acidobacteriota bacterium]HNH85067.1 GGDEF domain-containing protein [Acidobacteriota bacterium]
MRRYFLFAFLNLVLVGTAIVQIIDQPQVAVYGKIYLALGDLEQAAIEKSSQAVNTRIKELKTLDLMQKVHSEVYQAADKASGLTRKAQEADFEPLVKICRTEIDRLSTLNAQEASHRVHQKQPIWIVAALLCVINSVSFTYVGLRHRRESQLRSELELELSDKESALAQAMFHNRDRIITMLQQGRENRKLMTLLVKEREEALLDAMTGIYGVYSKKGMSKFYQVIASQLGRQPIGVAMLDIDFFKRVNDTLGHPAGDVVIKALAKILSKNIRTQDDFVIRFGGEEFVVVFPNVDPAELDTIIGRIQSEVRSTKIYVKDLNGQEVLVKSTIDPDCSITISCGYAQASESKQYQYLITHLREHPPTSLEGDVTPETWELLHDFTEELKTLVDKRLYVAKQSGRNQTCGPKTRVTGSLISG